MECERSANIECRFETEELTVGQGENVHSADCTENSSGFELVL